MPSKKISRRIFIKENIAKLEVDKESINEAVLSILHKEKPNFHLKTGSIHFDENLKHRLQIGVNPLFWSSIKPSVLKELYFQNVFVMTLFNPTDFFLNLEKLGIQSLKDPHTEKYFLGMKSEKGLIRFEHFNYFLLLIQNCLHTQEAVENTIREMIEQTKSNENVKPGVRMETQITHVFLDYNRDKL